jgi:hypothetical protein
MKPQSEFCGQGNGTSWQGVIAASAGNNQMQPTDNRPTESGHNSCRATNPSDANDRNQSAYQAILDGRCTGLVLKKMRAKVIFHRARSCAKMRDVVRRKKPYGWPPMNGNQS